MDLRREAGSPSATTLRGHLRTLNETGIVVRRRRDDFPHSLDYEMTHRGRGLLEVVEVLQAWLSSAPEGAVPLGSVAARSAIKALVEGWGTGMMHALAVQPLSLTELDGLIVSVSYPSLERRLDAMRLAGQVEPVPGSSRGKPYAVTEWLRHGVAPLAAAVHWERNVPDRTAPIDPLDIEAAFLLTVPLLRLPAGLSGSCRVTVDIPGRKERRLAGVVVEIFDGKIVSCTSRLEGSADAWITGSAAAWLSAAIETDTDRLKLGGDCTLARSLISDLQRSLTQVQ